MDLVWIIDYEIEGGIMEYQMLALVMLVGFYSIYAGKLIDQKKKGIQTDHLAKGDKNNTLRKLEFVLIIATNSMVIVEVISIALDLYLLNPTIRVLGIILGFIGVIVFGIAVYTMKDSWRAGIPGNEKTTMITDGIYSMSRNPAFVGFYLTYIGILLTFFNWVLLVFTIFTIIILHLQILKEEEYLTMAFGAEYTEYKKHVRRYIGRK